MENLGKQAFTGVAKFLLSLLVLIFYLPGPYITGRAGCTWRVWYCHPTAVWPLPAGTPAKSRAG